MTTHTVAEWSHVTNIAMGSLEVTSRCNSRCKTCNVWRLQQAHEKGKPELDRGALSETMSQLRDLGCPLIEFHGGEPTLRRDLPELVSDCTGLGMRSMFATNGLNMTEELASELVNAGLGEIRFSLEGPRETHNCIRGREDAFDKQVQAIEMIHRADTANRVTKAINTTISSLNIHCIEKIPDIAQQVQIKYVAVTLASVLGQEVVQETNDVFAEDVAYRRSLLDGELLIHDPALIERKREQLLRRAQECGICLNRSTFLTLPLSTVARGIKRPSGPCSHIYTACTVDSSGDVFPCEYLRYKLGNVREQPLKEILTSPRFRQFSKTYSENLNRLHICDYCCQSL